MTLTADQKSWADDHVGTETTATGVITAWRWLETGEVEFTVTFTATPPLSEAETQEREQRAEAERARVQSDAAAAFRAQLEEQDTALRAQLKDLVKEVLAEEQTLPTPANEVD